MTQGRVPADADPFAAVIAGTNDPLFERFSLIVNGPALFNALVTGVELGVFTAISAEPGLTLEGLAERSGVAADKLRALMLALCATGLVVRRAQGYANSSLAESFLAGDGLSSWRDILLGWQLLYYPAFAELTPALRSGTNTALGTFAGNGDTLYQRLEDDPKTERILHRAMSAFTVQSLPGLLDNARLEHARTLLDIGGGDGTTTRALAGRYPDLHITLFDLPSVAGIARNMTPDRSSIEVMSGNIFEDELPNGVDAVLFSHVLEAFSPTEIDTLLRKAFAALEPGGRLLVYGFNPPDDESAGVYSSRLALYLTTLATGKGMTYPASDYEQLLQAAGFEDVATVRNLPYEHGLTTGTRPS